jgi:hypothetical protein
VSDANSVFYSRQKASLAALVSRYIYVPGDNHKSSCINDHFVQIISVVSCLKGAFSAIFVVGGAILCRKLGVVIIKIGTTANALFFNY